jgi:hypothetical protein
MIYVFIAGIALLLIYEVYALKTIKTGDTITELIQKQRPLVPFAFGFLMGHFFW